MSSIADRGPVFISFASQDIEIADRFLKGIEAGGIRCWIAHRDIAPGTSYPAEVTGAIQSCAGMLVIITTAANASPHVLREVEMAFNAGKPILPVHLTAVPLSPNLTYFLSTKQWLDAGESFDEADTARVLHSLRQLLSESPAERAAAEAASQAPRPAPAERRRWLIPAVAAGVIALLVVAVLIWRRPDSSAPAASTSVASPAASVAAGPQPASSTPAAAGPADAVGKPPADVAANGTASAAGRRSRVNPRDGQTYMWIPAGEFTMGCSAGDASCDADEQPAHVVAIRRGFWLGRTEETGAQYRKVRPSGGSSLTPDSPVTEVTWAEAKSFCTAVGGRLPTESEWEYAARAGQTTRTHGPLDAISWFATNSEDHVHPVGQLRPNGFGLFDMLGNVHEWVLDRYFNSYGDEQDDGPVVEPVAPNASATVRGGAWTSMAKDVRVSARLEAEPDRSAPNIGFRCASDK
jgi:formylglycine-generating enzyme required for sulfatase activity